MKIIVAYEVPTAHGYWETKQVTVGSLEEADAVCRMIDRYEYRLKDLTRDPFED